MPEKEEFTRVVYNLLIHLEEHKNITLLATEEQLKEELNTLYQECENKINQNVKVI